MSYLEIEEIEEILDRKIKSLTDKMINNDPEKVSGFIALQVQIKTAKALKETFTTEVKERRAIR